VVQRAKPTAERMEEPICRICLAGAAKSGQELSSPCACRGSLRFVHLGCLRQFCEAHVESDILQEVVWRCPTCRVQYTSSIFVALASHALELCEASYGTASLEYAVALVNLGNAYGSVGPGNAESQKQLLESAMAIVEHQSNGIPFEYFPMLQKMFQGLAHALHILGADSEVQIDMLLHCQRISEEAYGQTDPQSMVMLGDIYVRIGMLQYGRDLYLQALDIYVALYGPDYPQVVFLLMKIGVAHGKLGDFMQKRTILEEALRRALHVFGSEHTEVGLALANLGSASMDVGRLADAVCFWWRAYCILKGEEDRDAVTVGELLDEARDCEKAALGTWLLHSALCEKPMKAGLGGQLLRAALAG